MYYYGETARNHTESTTLTLTQVPSVKKPRREEKGENERMQGGGKGEKKKTVGKSEIVAEVKEVTLVH